MKYVTLKDIAIINMGQSPDSKTYNREKNGIPFYQGKTDFGKINPIPRVWCSSPIKIAERDDILISVRAPIGDTNIATEKCCIGRGIASIRPLNKNINQKYLYYLLNSKYKELNKFGTGSTFKAITKDNLSNLKCTIIPDRKEQIEVVKKLDGVSQIIEIKKEQLEKLNTIIKSQFVEMFQSGNYPKEELGKLCDVRDGTHDSPKYMEKSDYKFITSKNIINNGIDFSDVKYISKKDYDKFNTRSKVNYGDILMPMIGTIGKPMIVNIPDSEIDFAIKNVALIKFLDNSQVTNIYIKYLLDSDYFENAILQNKRGGTQKFIALSDIRKIQIEIPPIELQNQFAEIVKQIDKQKFEIENSLKEMQELYESLMEKYFG